MQENKIKVSDAVLKKLRDAVAGSSGFDGQSGALLHKVAEPAPVEVEDIAVAEGDGLV